MLVVPVIMRMRFVVLDEIASLGVPQKMRQRHGVHMLAIPRWYA